MASASAAPLTLDAAAPLVAPPSAPEEAPPQIAAVPAIQVTAAPGFSVQVVAAPVADLPVAVATPLAAPLALLPPGAAPEEAPTAATASPASTSPPPLTDGLPPSSAEHGGCRVVRGDCVAGMRALATGSIDLVIADPPYNIAVQGAAWDTVPEYLNWSRTWLAEAARVLRPGGSLFIYGSPAKLWIARLKLIAADECGLEFKQHLSWVYKQGGDARLKGMVAYSVRMEHIEWFVKPGAAHTFNPAAAAEPYTEDERREALAKGVGRVTAESLDQGRPPRNWFDLPRENSRSKERQYGSHPSMKPLKLCERLLLVHSNPGDAVVIPFGGSGSEAVAAALASRRVVAYELDPNYYTIILRRLVGWALFPPHLAPAQPAPTAAALADAAADAADAAAAATAAAGEGGDGGDGGAAAAPAAAAGGGGLPLLRDARFSSGYPACTGWGHGGWRR